MWGENYVVNNSRKIFYTFIKGGMVLMSRNRTRCFALDIFSEPEFFFCPKIFKLAPITVCFINFGRNWFLWKINEKTKMYLVLPFFGTEKQSTTSLFCL